MASSWFSSIAQAMHNASRRSAKPFVAINCAAFPEPLLESELFGYEEGAFTGARKGGKAGLFEVAHTGTMFLDEVGDMPLTLQTRLLRVLQEKEVVRLGSSDTIPVDVRIIAATHQQLLARVRAEDVPILATQLLQAALQRLASSLPAAGVIAGIDGPLCRYAWPGNVRELENVMERLAVFLSAYRDERAIDSDELRMTLPELFDAGENGSEPTRGSLSDRAIQEALAAAERPGISRTTLWRRLRAMPTC